MSLKVVRKAVFLTLGALLGGIFGSSFTPKASYKPEVIQERIEANVDIVRQFMDQKYGKGYFDKQIAKQALDDDLFDMIKT